MSAVQWHHKNVTVSDAGRFNTHDADNLLANVTNNCQPSFKCTLIRWSKMVPLILAGYGLTDRSMGIARPRACRHHSIHFEITVT